MRTIFSLIAIKKNWREPTIGQWQIHISIHSCKHRLCVAKQAITIPVSKLFHGVQHIPGNQFSLTEWFKKTQP